MAILQGAQKCYKVIVTFDFFSALETFYRVFAILESWKNESNPNPLDFMIISQPPPRIWLFGVLIVEEIFSESIPYLRAFS